MNTLRKIRKNTKALSPVVASIILIAVTVAVSIAVAAWMGALTIGFMATEELKITGVQFNDDETVSISVINQGASGLEIVEASVVGVITETESVPVAANSPETVTVALDWDLGSNYQ